MADLLTVTDQTDETGRLLLEDSAPPRARRRAERAQVPMEVVTCPYRDTPSRHGGRMNRSAYEALRADTAAILRGFAWLSRHAFERREDARATPAGLATVSKLGVTMPLVLFLRARDPVPPRGRLPSFIASIFKASRGVYSAAFDLAHERADDPVTAAELVGFADEHGHLRREDTDRVCAAPTRLIERTIEVMLGRGDDEESAATASRLGEHVDFDELWRFHQLEQDLARTLSGYRSLLERLLSTSPASDPSQLFALPVRHGGSRRPFGVVTEEVLDRANAIQRDLNAVLGRAEGAPPVTFGDLLRAF